ncbi:nuclear transport factor 2 family protein [Arthrobacter sp. H5]|uniref:nuclear transport factor 2 family protein n=1 Tax=Arthrobacter sp. H5 TaxID=1267973 RepID=UPI0004AF1EC9|nr:nuclear transport factor 2 family protein [Arthrobacter sp. H5]
MTQHTTTQAVRDFHHAWTRGDIETAMTLVSDDIVCRTPGADLVGKDAYAHYLAGFAPSLTGVPEIAIFEDGERIALFYYPQTTTTTTAPAAECFTVRDGLIIENVLIFDRLSYAPSGTE